MDTDYASYTPPDLHIPWWMQVLFAWSRTHQSISILLTLIAIDIILGFSVAFVKKTTSSTICWRGMVRKVSTLLILGAVGVVGPVMPQIPSFELACYGFIAAELVSILEAAAALGVPLPVVLVDSLIKLKQQAAMRDSQKTVAPPVAPVASQNVVVVNPAPAPHGNVSSTTTSVTETTQTK